MGNPRDDDRLAALEAKLDRLAAENLQLRAALSGAEARRAPVEADSKHDPNVQSPGQALYRTLCVVSLPHPVHATARSMPTYEDWRYTGERAMHVAPDQEVWLDADVARSLIKQDAIMLADEWHAGQRAAAARKAAIADLMNVSGQSNLAS